MSSSRRRLENLTLDKTCGRKKEKKRKERKKKKTDIFLFLSLVPSLIMDNSAASSMSITSAPGMGDLASGIGTNSSSPKCLSSLSKAMSRMS